MLKCIEKLKTSIKFLLKEKKELEYLIEESNKVIRDLLKIVETLPTNNLGNGILLFAKNVLPTDRVIMIKYSPSTRTHQLNIFNMNPTTIRDFNLDIYCANKFAEQMKDEKGILRSVYKKFIN